MTKPVFSMFVSVLLIIVAVTPAFGASQKKRAPERHNTVIGGVTANSVTLIDDKTTRTLTITQFTEIHVNGQRATVADLKPEMTVTVVLGTDPTKASRINATGAPPKR
jgi:hypothetical protein